MKKVRGIFPGIFTMGNLFCGFLSILSSLDGNAIHASWLIILAGFFDALDGWIARFSRATSRFGIELDSLADFISFGIAPAVIFYSFKLYVLGKWGFIVGFVFILCGAFRLARYNLNAKSEKSNHYTGLPIPMSACTIAGYALFCYYLWGELRFPEILISMIIAFSGLMVSSISYDTLPSFHLGNRKNNLKLMYVGVALVALLIKPSLAFFPLGILYVLSGVGREIYGILHNPKKEKVLEESYGK